MSITKSIPTDVSVENPLFEYTLFVRITDINYGNHLAAAAVPGLIHEIRVAFLNSYQLSESAIEDGVGLILRDQYFRFASEASYHDALMFKMDVVDIAKHSATIAYEIINLTKNKKMGFVSEKIVFFNYVTKKVSSTPETFKALISRLKNTAAP